MEKGKVWYAFQTNSMKCPSWVLYFRIHASVAFQGLPWWLSGKESACQCRRSKNHGSERSPGEGNSNPFPYPCLENPMDRGVCRLQPRDFSSCLNTISAQYPSDGACENLLLFITWSVSCQIVGIFFLNVAAWKDSHYLRGLKSFISDLFIFLIIFHANYFWSTLWMHPKDTPWNRLTPSPNDPQWALP